MTKAIFSHLDSPALVVIKEQVEQNIANALRMVGDASRLRPHIKTNKSPDLTRLLLAAGITKFKCATIAEAEMLGQCSAPDVLLAYQPVGPKVERFVSLIKNYPTTRYSCLVDDIAAANFMAEAFANHGLTVPVFVDVNIGHNRTGIAPAKVLELWENLGGKSDLPLTSNAKGIQPIGLQAYDGHVREVNFGRRTTACEEAYKPIAQLKKQIMAMGFDAPIIIAGGSPTFPIHAQRPDVECSPGTFVYWDKGYSDICPEQPFQPAAWLLTRVISKPDDTKICLDLGHKSVAAENDLGKRIFFPDHPQLIPIGQSEEHLVMEAGENHSFQVGDALLGIPYHICPTVALYEKVFVVENNKVSGEWKTIARDRFINKG
jgi:D-serine deaminase-like pyridoxal phosphate-dependent protein